jgi:hypothetical protein
MNQTNSDGARQPTQQDSRRGARGEGTRREGQGHSVDFARLRDLAGNLSAQLGEQARKRPYVTAGAVASIGFVAGSMFGSRLGQLLLAASAGYFAKSVLAGSNGIERLQDNLERLAHERTNA